jgi:predicted Rossmann-fold nucleotide-binding protein
MAIVVYGSAYWNEVINFQALVKHDMISPEDLSLFQFADDPETAFELLKPGLAVYAAQVDLEMPAFAKSRNPQQTAGTP